MVWYRHQTVSTSLLSLGSSRLTLDLDQTPTSKHCELLCWVQVLVLGLGASWGTKVQRDHRSQKGCSGSSENPKEASNSLGRLMGG